jgi:tetratricopeptide (TPR) repeat protein
MKLRSGFLRSVSLAASTAMCVGVAGADTLSHAPMQSPGDVLQLPGMPPIQMPPGSRVFGPNDQSSPQNAPIPRRRDQAATPAAPDKKAEAAKPAAPRVDMTDPAARKKLLDDLFDKLGKAGDDAEAHVLTAAIERMWLRSGSDTADLLMSRAGEAMQTKDYDLTLQVLDKVVELLPDWAEGWNKRATARFSSDDISGAVEDIAHTLAIEPRHFDALAGLGFIMQKMDMSKSALQAFRKALDVNPRQEQLRKIVEKLAVEVDGRDI